MAYLNSSSTQRTSCWKGYPARPSQRDQRGQTLSRSPLRRTYLKNDADEETGYYGEDTGYYVATDVKPTTAREHLSKLGQALWPFYCHVGLFKLLELKQKRCKNSFSYGSSGKMKLVVQTNYLENLKTS